MSGVSRRGMLIAGLGAMAAFGLAGAGTSAYAGPARPAIHPRADWAGGRSASGTLKDEDVRFLIIHHSESPNTEKPGSIPGRLRSFFDYHTGTKGWPDVAYNFFVDPFGEIWEGRTGSLAGPVRGDATGGSQGYAQLCCFVGDHTASLPTDAAMTAMTALVAWLADRYRIDLAGSQSIAFTSRGSNRWPKGTEVTTDPVVGHRDMSQTSCPGEALYPLVRSQILPGARALLGAQATSVAAPLPTPAQSPKASALTSSEQTRGTSAPPPAISTEPAGAEVGESGLREKLGDLAVPLAVGAGVLGVGAIAGGVLSGQKPR
ncbi:N-acetylmuramoyl-L-alanine amidase [Granulicoccus sp. GXG6511]|uniref:N-acetylmuramoyl-L-alanine amidase n=1 Tax=Granulicoccus sp. GXG6511 TaxID=3381351 RepID=UPI003D7D1746